MTKYAQNNEFAICQTQVSRLTNAKTFYADKNYKSIFFVWQSMRNAVNQFAIEFIHYNGQIF